MSNQDKEPFEKATSEINIRLKPSEKEAYKKFLGNMSKVARNMLNEAVRRKRVENKEQA
jgi:flagellar motor switch protein FliG